MSNQKKKEERELIDRGNIYDPGNCHSDRNYNPKKHKKITDEIINFYIPCKNFNCELNYQRKILKLDIDPPKCFSTCYKKVGIHGCGKDGSYPVAEFMTKWVRKNSEAIYIKRPDALFNWYYKLPFIFRPGWGNDFHLHHWKHPLYDSPEYISMIKSSDHTKITSAVTSINRKILGIQEIISLDESKYYLYKSEISKLQNEKEKISRIDTDPDFWRYIEKMNNEISNLQEV